MQFLVRFILKLVEKLFDKVRMLKLRNWLTPKDIPFVNENLVWVYVILDIKKRNSVKLLTNEND